MHTNLKRLPFERGIREGNLVCWEIFFRVFSPCTLVLSHKGQILQCCTDFLKLSVGKWRKLCMSPFYGEMIPYSKFRTETRPFCLSCAPLKTCHRKTLQSILCWVYLSYLLNDSTEMARKSRFLVFLHQRYHLFLGDDH